MYTVMTIIIGDYEKVHEVRIKSPNARYILVTDNPQLKSETWQVVYDDKLKGNVWDKVMYVRWHPWDYTDDDMVVSVDGSIIINRPLDRMVNLHAKMRKDLTLMIHPSRTGIADEYAVWVKHRGYPQERADNCMELMRECGYDVEKHQGLLQMGFMIRSRNDKVMQWCDDVYKTLLITGGGHCDRLDQTIASFVLQRYFRFRVMCISEWQIKGPMMTLCKHGTDIQVRRRGMCMPYLYDIQTRYTIFE